jgi:hypothetical protein
MFHRIIIFILLSCILSTYFTRDFVVISFEMNQEKIAQTMCVNKDKPWMHCNGRCYLMNKVKQAEENEKKQATKDFRSALQLVWLINPSSIQANTLQQNPSSKRELSHYRYTYSNQYNASIFRPPKSLYSS